jgi:hypothetical protein
MARHIVPGPRVLSLKQPWAWAVSIGKKKVENRTWSTGYRGSVYIHASSKLDRDALEWLRRHTRLIPPADLPHRAVVAVADLDDVVSGRDGKTKFGKWFFGPFGFVLKNVRPLPRPVPTNGKLGLFRATAELQAHVTKELRRARCSSR